MKTAWQSGWSMTCSDTGFITLYNDFGDYFECWANADGVVRFSEKSDVALGDLPRSVISLICLWLDVVNPF